ncbi:MAG: glycosyltransferase family 2 protein [Candidatus Competibacteraceae bacterium]
MRQIDPYIEQKLNSLYLLPVSEKYVSPQVLDEVVPGPELSIIIPTYNEQGNISELVNRLTRCLAGYSWEAIFVDDDSPDGTADRIMALSKHDSRIRCLRRIGRRGLASACVEGMLASTASYLAVIDADLQHDEKLLPQMLCLLKEDQADIVVGSRYIEGGGIGNWNKSRAKISRLATRLSRSVVPAELTDPMSGFFMLKRDVFAKSVHHLSAIGFKILLDLFASSPQPLRYKELPYHFRNRHAGNSKLDSMVGWDYGMLLLDKLVGHLVPVRFIAFSIIGVLGIAVHLLTLGMLLTVLDRPFFESQAIATGVAMTSNFAINNVLTYRDLRLRGWKWIRGWILFTLVCSVGAIANVGIASYLYQAHIKWIPAAIAGIMVGAVWNYAVTKTYTWHK